jgi:hypothetical protein
MTVELDSSADNPLQNTSIYSFVEVAGHTKIVLPCVENYSTEITYASLEHTVTFIESCLGSRTIAAMRLCWQWQCVFRLVRWPHS